MENAIRFSSFCITKSDNFLDFRIKMALKYPENAALVIFEVQDHGMKPLLVSVLGLCKITH